MKISLRFAVASLLLVATTWLRAAETNQSPTLPPVAWKTPLTNPPAKQERSKIRPDRPSNEERRARIELWRAEHGGTNRPAGKINASGEDTSHLPLSERRAHLRAKLDEMRQKTNSVPPATAPTNSLPATPVAPK